MPISRKRPVVLAVLDGWGYRAEREGNAIALASTPTWDALWRSPVADAARSLRARGGPPRGPDGEQRSRAPQPRRWARGAAGPGAHRQRDHRRLLLPQRGASWRSAGRCARAGGTLHLAGLIGGGGVHAMDRHLFALFELAERDGLPRVALHALLDGRDTLPRSALGYLRETVARAAGARGDRLARRPLLRHGPRPPLAAHRAVVPRDGERRGATRRRSARRDPGGVRPRRERRVRHADR